MRTLYLLDTQGIFAVASVLVVKFRGTKAPKELCPMTTAEGKTHTYTNIFLYIYIYIYICIVG